MRPNFSVIRNVGCFTCRSVILLALYGVLIQSVPAACIYDILQNLEGSPPLADMIKRMESQGNLRFVSGSVADQWMKQFGKGLAEGLFIPAYDPDAARILASLDEPISEPASVILLPSRASLDSLLHEYYHYRQWQRGSLGMGDLGAVAAQVMEAQTELPSPSQDLIVLAHELLELDTEKLNLRRARIQGDKKRTRQWESSIQGRTEEIEVRLATLEMLLDTPVQFIELDRLKKAYFSFKRTLKFRR